MAADPASDGVDLRIRQLIDALPEAVLMFDTDLTIQVAGGKPLRDYGFDPATLEGRPLADVVSQESFAALAGVYSAAISGHPSDIDYTDPVAGGHFLVRVRPIIDPSGAVLGVMSVTSDVAERLGIDFERDEIQRIIPFGSATYDRRYGWTASRALLDIYGIDEQTGAEPFASIDQHVVTEDRDAIRSMWADLLGAGGKVSGFDYRIVDARTGEIRHLHGTVEVELGADGALLTAMTTQVDITELIRARMHAADIRHRLVRDVGSVVARADGEVRTALQLIADLTLSSMAAACTIRVVSRDGRRVEWTLSAHHDRARQADLTIHLTTSATEVAGLQDSLADAIAARKLVRGTFEAVADGVPSWADGMRYVAAPMRHNGGVRGLFTVARDPSDADFDEADADLVQFLADRMGAMLDADAARDVAAAGRRDITRMGYALQAVVSDQQQLVQHLDRTEGRERMRLAEAVHDEPLQHVVAAMLRLDTLSSQPADAADESVEKVLGMLETAVAQLRTLIATLTPPDLTLGLGPALRQLAKSTFASSTTQVTVTGPDHVSLDPHAEESVYRIIREGLINAHKHARCSHVTIDLAESIDLVTIRLSDDGIGMDYSAEQTQAEPGHLGLASMRARAVALHANLLITRRPGGGTVIEMALPPAAPELTSPT